MANSNGDAIMVDGQKPVLHEQLYTLELDCLWCLNDVNSTISKTKELMNCDNVYKRFPSAVVCSHCVAYERLWPTQLSQPHAWLVGMETAQVYTYIYLNKNEMLHMETTHTKDFHSDTY